MKQSQGRRIIAALTVRPHTYGDMLRLGVSTAPWRRVQECLAANERIIKVKRGDLIAWRVKVLRDGT
jgi:hypothetical protein